MPDLFAIEDLASWPMMQDLDTATATLVRTVVSAWLADATALSAWPDPVPDVLKGWALELAGIVLTNPTSLTSEGIGSYTSTYGSVMADRRESILAAAAAWARRQLATGLARGQFDDSLPWPDPAKVPWFYYANAWLTS